MSAPALVASTDLDRTTSADVELGHQVPGIRPSTVWAKIGLILGARAGERLLRHMEALELAYAEFEAELHVVLVKAKAPRGGRPTWPRLRVKPAPPEEVVSARS